LITREATVSPVRGQARFTSRCLRRGCARRARWRGRGPGRARS
jgi:hypothetical protein